MNNIDAEVTELVREEGIELANRAQAAEYRCMQLGEKIEAMETDEEFAREIRRHFRSRGIRKLKCQGLMLAALGLMVGLVAGWCIR